MRINDIMDIEEQQMTNIRRHIETGPIREYREQTGKTIKDLIINLKTPAVRRMSQQIWAIYNNPIKKSGSLPKGFSATTSDTKQVMPTYPNTTIIIFA